MTIHDLDGGYQLIIDQRIGGWVAERVPGMTGADDFGPYVSLGIGRGGEIIGGVVYNGYRKGYSAVELTAAATSPAWLGVRATARALLSYPFEQLGVGRITTYTRASNHRALKLNRLLGFREEGRLRRGFGDSEDAVICGLLRDEVPAWLKLSGGDNQQKETSSPRPGADGGCADRDQSTDGAL